MSLVTNRGATRILTVGWLGLTAPKLILLDASSALLTKLTNVVSDLTEYGDYAGGFEGADRESPDTPVVTEVDGSNLAKASFSATSIAGANGPDRIAPIYALIEEITNDGASNVIHSGGIKTAANVIDVTAATEDSPGVLTANGHGMSDGEIVYLEGFAGGTWDQINRRAFKVDNADANTFTLVDEAATAVNTSAFGTATLTSAKAYRPFAGNGAAITITPDSDGVLQAVPEDQGGA